MKCEPALISAYLDGALTPSRRRQIESHLRGCPACRGALHDYQVLRRGVNALPWQQAPAHLHGAVRAQIAAHLLRSSRRRRPWAPLTGAAAVAVVALGAVSATNLLAPAAAHSSGGRPVVAFSLPSNQAENIPSNSVIELHFGAPVDRNAVQQAIAVSPPVAAHMEWQEEKLRIVPEAKLDPDTTYTISVAPPAAGAGPAPFTVQLRTAPPADAGERPRLPTEPAAPPAALAALAPAATPTPASPQASPRLPSMLSVEPSDPLLPPGCSQRLAAALVRLSRERPDLTARLGCAAGSETTAPFTEQPFETGLLLRRDDAGRVYVLQAQPRRWRLYHEESAGRPAPAPWESGLPGEVRPGAAPFPLRIATMTPVAMGLPTEPATAFLGIWRLYPELRGLLGGPTGRSRRGAAVIQEFEHGLVALNERGGLYALSADANWIYLPEPPEAARLPRTTP